MGFPLESSRWAYTRFFWPTSSWLESIWVRRTLWAESTPASRNPANRTKLFFIFMVRYPLTKIAVENFGAADLDHVVELQSDLFDRRLVDEDLPLPGPEAEFSPGTPEAGRGEGQFPGSPFRTTSWPPWLPRVRWR